ncbi:MAG: flagellum-specific peptidoglycan hydrolase FlgJ [Flavobacteriaceae bacterium]|jgi:flagellum-specific peptidoglycan hydrolase FlgJ|tara:strand:- start:9838 stop:10614 length:777 start_codon:yes stop_codon:yes gene_type:complete
MVLVYSCGASRKVVEREQVPGSPKKEIITVAKQKKFLQKKSRALTTEEKIAAYIEKFGPIAKAEMQKYKIPASITLAQGLLESGMGYGRLASDGNNHFGIKCHTNWNGKRIFHDDDEKGECFRVYKDPATSYRDHSLFLTNRSRYASLFDLKTNDYRGWAKGLKKAGYATDPKYPNKLISLIDRFDLTRFDEKINKKAMNISKQKKKRSSKDLHIVKKGDTLYSVSKKYNITIDQLIKSNKIKDKTIYLGQTLTITNP